MTYSPEDRRKAQTSEPGFWRAQRVAWMLLIVLLGVVYLGLTGVGGAYSYDIVGDKVFSVKYPVVLQQQKQGTISVTSAQPHAETVLHFDRAFLDTFKILAMSPAPSKEFETSWGVAYRFAQSSDAKAGMETVVRIVVSSDKLGVSSYSIVVDGRMAMLSTMIVP